MWRSRRRSGLVYAVIPIEKSRIVAVVKTRLSLQTWVRIVWILRSGSSILYRWHMAISSLTAISVERHCCGSKGSAQTNLSRISPVGRTQVQQGLILRPIGSSSWRTFVEGKTQNTTLVGALRKARGSTTTPSARPNIGIDENVPRSTIRANSTGADATSDNLLEMVVVGCLS